MIAGAEGEPVQPPDRRQTSVAPFSASAGDTPGSHSLSLRSLWQGGRQPGLGRAVVCPFVNVLFQAKRGGSVVKSTYSSCQGPGSVLNTYTGWREPPENSVL